MSNSDNEFAPPPLCLRVGVTGNRWRLENEGPDVRINPANRETLETTVRYISTLVTRAVSAAHGRGIGEKYYADTPYTIRLISPLAEGGDRVVATVVTSLAEPWELYVLAPEDISKKPDRDPHIPLAPLWGKAKGHLTIGGLQLDEDSLVEVNQRLVWNCDLLFAIWDKHGARGEAGTGNVIQLASELGLPVVNIDAEPKPEGEGRNSTSPHAFRVLEPNGTKSRDNDEKAIEAVVSRLLGPPPDAAHDEYDSHHKGGSAREMYDAFRAERVSSGFVRNATGMAWGAVMWLLTRGSKHRVHVPSSRIKSGVDKGHPPAWEGVDPPRPFVGGFLDAIVSPVFRRSDYFATAYAMRHRGATVWLVLLAPIAVMLAWIGQLPAEVWESNAVLSELHIPTAMVYGEMILLFCILAIYWRAQKKKFHERWLDYRLLAERLRHLGFLWFAARGSLVQRVPVLQSPEDPHTAWVNWCYRATARAVPLPSVQFTTPYLAWYKEFLRDRIVKDQKRYLIGTFHAAEIAQHRLHLVAWVPFGLAIVAAGLHAAHAHFVSEHALAFVALVLPGFGAALHAFGSNLGLPEQVVRSRSTIRALSVVLESLDKVHIDQTRGSSNLQTAITLGELAQQTASALGDDLVGWRVDYLVRPTPQPG